MTRIAVREAGGKAGALGQTGLSSMLFRSRLDGFNDDEGQGVVRGKSPKNRTVSPPA